MAKTAQTMSRYFWAALLCAGAAGGPTSVFANDCVTSADKTIAYNEGGMSLVGARLVDYIAVIGDRDLYNSKGEKLSSFEAVLHQDRANYHKTDLADRFDEIFDGAEHYFDKAERRATLSKAPYYYDCAMSEQDIAQLHSNTLSGANSVIWVILFKQENGALAVYASPVG